MTTSSRFRRTRMARGVRENFLCLRKRIVPRARSAPQATWTVLPNSPFGPFTLTIDATNPDVLYAGVSSAGFSSNGFRIARTAPPDAP